MQVVFWEALPGRRVWLVACIRAAIGLTALVVAAWVPQSTTWLVAGAGKFVMIWSAFGVASHIEGKIMSGFADMVFGPEDTSSNRQERHGQGP